MVDNEPVSLSIQFCENRSFSQCFDGFQKKKKITDGYNSYSHSRFSSFKKNELFLLVLFFVTMLFRKLETENNTTSIISLIHRYIIDNCYWWGLRQNRCHRLSSYLLTVMIKNNISIEIVIRYWYLIIL